MALALFAASFVGASPAAGAGWTSCPSGYLMSVKVKGVSCGTAGRVSPAAFAQMRQSGATGDWRGRVSEWACVYRMTTDPWGQPTPAGRMACSKGAKKIAVYFDP